MRRYGWNGSGSQWCIGARVRLSVNSTQIGVIVDGPKPLSEILGTMFNLNTSGDSQCWNIKWDCDKFENGYYQQHRLELI